MRIFHRSLEIGTLDSIQLHDLTAELRRCVKESGIGDGFVLVGSPHTTTGIVVNENEPRLLVDVRRFLEELAPADGEYLHNDIHLRHCPPDEPRNAHSHLLAILMGHSTVLPIREGELGLGRWQSVFLVELDGPRTRTVDLQLFGE